MIQKINIKNLEIEGLESDLEIFLKIQDISNQILFIHPVLSRYFDELTTFKFVHYELLSISTLDFLFPKKFVVKMIPKLDFKTFKENSLNFSICFHENKLNFNCLSPELGIFYMLQDLNSLSVSFALGLLEYADVSFLKKYNSHFLQDNIIDFLLDLGKISLNRYDLIWKVIENHSLTTCLHDLPLFLDRNIRTERKYDKIL